MHDIVSFTSTLQGDMEHAVILVHLILFAIVCSRSCADLCDAPCNATCAVATLELSPTERCRCDEDCTAYGDCCGDRPQCGDGSSPEPIPGLECRRTENVFLGSYSPGGVGLREAYWMVSACPPEWLASPDALRADINANCTEDKGIFPPVSDNATGIVYKNEFCAVCNRVRSAVPWSYGLGCTLWLNEELRLAEEGYVEFDLTLDILLRECLVCGYEPPQFTRARACYPHVSSCLPSEEAQAGDYELLVEQCASEPFNPVLGKFEKKIYRNEYCALCNDDPITECVPLPGQTYRGSPIPTSTPSFCAVEAQHELGQQLRPASNYTNGSSSNDSFIVGHLTPFSVVFNVGSGQVQVSVGTVSVEITCRESELYDPVIQDCRPIVCPEIFHSEMMGGCIFTNTSCSEGGFIELTKDDDYQLLNNSTIIYDDTEYEIVEFNEGNPVICANLSINGTSVQSFTETFFSYPPAYSILTFVGCTLSLGGVAIILLSLALFKELRTMTTTILVNLSMCIVVINLLVVVGGPVTHVVQSRPLCEAVSIVNHFFFLALFVWMTIMTVEITRTLMRGVRLMTSPSKKANRRTFIVYFIIGWSSPLAIVGPSVIVNFVPATSHLVLYGRMEDGTDGLCWINHNISLFLAFLLPVALCLIVNLGGLVVVSTILINAVRNQIHINRSTTYAYVRVYVAVFFSSGATWLFGFVAVAADYEWVWYPFIIFNTLQGFTLFLAFMWTKKVAALYLEFFTCGRLDYRSTTTSKDKTNSTDSASSIKKRSLTLNLSGSNDIKSPDSNGVVVGADHMC